MRNKSFPRGFWPACFALFVLGFGFTAGIQEIGAHIITREVVVSQSAILFTDEQRINFFIGELLTSTQASCFRKVLNHETHHMNARARNPRSTATGVGQLLKSTYRNLGFKTTVRDAIAQTVAALAYISERYGSAGPCGAWKHEQQKGWY